MKFYHIVSYVISEVEALVSHNLTIENKGVIADTGIFESDHINFRVLLSVK